MRPGILNETNSKKSTYNLIIMSGNDKTHLTQLEDLPIELLILIFDYCHAFDLVRISQVCKKFHFLVKDELLWNRRSGRSLVTNQKSKRFRDRCRVLLSGSTKWKVTHNWEYGRYQSNVLFSQNTKLMPWIRLTDNLLWCSGGNYLSAYNRSDKPYQTQRIFHQRAQSDFCKFAVCNDHIVSGHRDGSLKFWKIDMNINGSHDVYSIHNAHSRDVDAVDETSNVIFSGSSDAIVKAWMVPETLEDLSFIPVSSIRLADRVWSLATDPSGSKLAIGTAGNMGVPLYVCDVNNFKNNNVLNHNWQRGAGILDMVWENSHTLLTGGYDTCVRKWDLRTGTCVCHWSDPTDATIYCLSSDYEYTIVTGTQFNCKSVLWDQRKSQYVQLYFMNLRRMSSPVYSVSFDSCNLYGATDQTVVEVKFSGQPNVKKNYRKIMNYEIFSSN